MRQGDQPEAARQRAVLSNPRIPVVGEHHDAECVWCGGLMSIPRFGAAVHADCLAESAHRAFMVQRELAQDLRLAWEQWEPFTEAPSFQMEGHSGQLHTLELGQPLAPAVRADRPGFIADLIEEDPFDAG